MSLVGCHLGAQGLPDQGIMLDVAVVGVEFLAGRQPEDEGLLLAVAPDELDDVAGFESCHAGDAPLR